MARAIAEKLQIEPARKRAEETGSTFDGSISLSRPTVGPPRAHEPIEGTT